MSHITPTGFAQEQWGGKRLPGERFTEPQKHTMQIKRGTIEGWDVRTVELKVPRPRRGEDGYRPIEECVDLVSIECPILYRGAEYDTVISTGGDVVRLKAARRRR